MPTTSSQSLYDSVNAFAETGFAHASDTRPQATNFNRIISDIRNEPLRFTDIIKEPNPLILISNKTQELQSAIKQQYPQAADDLVAHYSASLYLAEKISSPASAFIGLVKELIDLTGNLVGMKGEASFDDLGANFAGFSGLTPEEAFQGGYLTRQQLEAGKSTSIEGTLLGLGKEFADLLDPLILATNSDREAKIANVLTAVRGSPYQKPAQGFFGRTGGGGTITPFVNLYYRHPQAGTWQTLATVKGWVIDAPGGVPDLNSEYARGYSETRNESGSLVFATFSWPEAIVFGTDSNSYRVAAGSASVTVGYGLSFENTNLYPVSVQYQKI